MAAKDMSDVLTFYRNGAKTLGVPVARVSRRTGKMPTGLACRLCVDYAI